MRLAEELLLTRPLAPGHELAVALMLTREHLAHLHEVRVLRPAGLTDPQFNILRILRGGPPEGCTIGDLKRRVITRAADVPRLVDRLGRLGLVRRVPNPQDRRSCRVTLTPKAEALLAATDPTHTAFGKELEALLPPERLGPFLEDLQRLRDGLRGVVEAHGDGTES